MSALSWLLLGGSIALAFLAFRVQKKHWINIPIWDEWDTPGLALLQYAQGVLSWEDLFAQHNESRKVVPRLIHIAIASVAGWDVRQGMVLTFLCTCAVSVWALVYLRRRAANSPTLVLFPWLLINLFLFAPSQYENFLSGFVFEIFIPFLCLFGCAAINLSRWPLPLKSVGNSLLALIATYTFAHGMLLWGFAIPIPNREERSRGWRFFLCWSAVYVLLGTISIACYFVGYRRPEIVPPAANLAQFGQVLEFLFVWLGGVVRAPWLNVRLAGALVSLLIAAALAGTFVALRKNKERWPAYYPWLLLLGFALSSGIVTAVGRVNIGVDDVFNTFFIGFSGMRYNATSVFVYVAVIGIVLNVYQDQIRQEPSRRRRFRIGAAVCYLLLAVAWIEMFTDESIRVKQFQANRRRARTAAIWSDAIPNNPEIFLAYPYPDQFGQRVEKMRAAGLLKLPKASDSLRQAVGGTPATNDSSAGKLTLFEPRGGGYHRFAGWARNPHRNSIAHYVVLGWTNAGDSFHPFTAISTGIVRPEVAAAYGASSLKAGFDHEIEISKWPPEAMTIKAWAIDWDTQQAFPLEGALAIPR